MSILDIRKTARRGLHEAMRVPASYYETEAATPRLIYVRVHSKMIQQGDLKGTNLNYAEREEESPHVLFDRAEVDNPPRGAMVILSDSEGYRTGATEPPDGITVKAEVARMRAAELVGKTMPEDLM